jgi:inward rectifier potassium channel
MPHPTNLPATPHVEPARHPRVVPRDGEIRYRVEGVRTLTLGDAYHAAMTVRWPTLLACIFAIYVAANVLFAVLYRVGGDCIASADPDSFADALFFSVQTFATIGYGAMAPKTTYAHVVVAMEAFLGMATTALCTGLMFARFSRPTARVTFANSAVIAKRNGVRTLMFRMANDRANSIVEARLQVALTRMETTAEGERVRRFHDLELVRSQNMLFALSWTAMHELRPGSPLERFDVAELERDNAELVVSFVGLDATMNQTVHARWSYLPHEIREGHRYVDIVRVHEDGTRALDYARIHDTAAEPTSLA